MDATRQAGSGYNSRALRRHTSLSCSPPTMRSPSMRRRWLKGSVLSQGSHGTEYAHRHTCACMLHTCTHTIHTWHTHTQVHIQHTTHIHRHICIHIYTMHTYMYTHACTYMLRTMICPLSQANMQHANWHTQERAGRPRIGLPCETFPGLGHRPTPESSAFGPEFYFQTQNRKIEVGLKYLVPAGNRQNYSKCKNIS